MGQIKILKTISKALSIRKNNNINRIIGWTLSLLQKQNWKSCSGVVRYATLC